MPQLVLASTSAYRRMLLERLKLPFTVQSPDVDESALPGESATELVRRLARSKADAVASELGTGLIIGSDQVAVHGDRILGKPGDHATATRQLEQLSGEDVDFITGLALINAADGSTQIDSVRYAVRFHRLSADQIEHYLRQEQPYDCAGAIKTEALGIALLEHMTGPDPSALIGLPLIRLCEMLRTAGLEPLQAQ